MGNNTADLTYRDGVRDALSGFMDERTRHQPDGRLPTEYLTGRDVTEALKANAHDPEALEGERDYWRGFLAALRLDPVNDLDPSAWYAEGVRDGHTARERVNDDGEIGGYTDTPGNHWVRCRVAILDATGEEAVSVSQSYTHLADALHDAETLVKAGHNAHAEGQVYAGRLGEGEPVREWIIAA